jgi:hypothetical protein
MDASGWRYLVELLRVAGRRFGGGENLSHGVRKAYSCEGRERRPKRMTDACRPEKISQFQCNDGTEVVNGYRDDERTLLANMASKGPFD